MNVGQLKKLIENAADNTPILIPSSDHGYCEARADFTTAVLDMRNRSWSEDFDYEDGGYGHTSKLSRRNAIVIS